ncbi:MAG: MmgE/PrpD family protein [Chloroflexi bacterium]|nr:MmgE/PrpD family protein [Chloroflexota bacterium]
MGAVEESLARFVAETSPEAIPRASYQAARQGCFDCIGVTLAGAAQAPGQMIARFVAEQESKPVCTVIGTPVRASPHLAALANGTLGHVLDYDDMGAHGYPWHPSVSLLPAALALGEELGVGGKEVLTAYLIGFEVAAHLSFGSRSPQAESGFHATAVFGALGATAVACRLLELDTQQTLMALGLAASMPSGILQNFGTHAKSLHAGMACRNGVLAASLARQGWKATDAFIESKVGWAHAYLGEDKYHPEQMVRGLGKTWHSEHTIVIKKYPCCGASHSAVDSLLSLMAEHGLRYEDVKEVHVSLLPALSYVLLYPKPEYGFQGKFSIQYSLAAALLDGGLGIESFEDGAALRPEVQEALDKITVHVLPHWDPGDYAANPVRLVLQDGRALERSTSRHQMHGTPLDPLGEEELKDKFLGCARRSLPEAQARQALAAWWDLERAQDIREPLRTVALDR